MEIGSILSAPSAATGTGARTESIASASSFAGTLAGQQQLDAARAVLTTLPAPIVYSLRDRAGSPADAVDRLFAALKDGSFAPPDGPLGRPGTIINATAHAATLFDSPAQLWDAMRAGLADPAAAATALRGLPPSAPPAPVAADAEPLPEVHTLEDAERLLTQLRPGLGSAVLAPPMSQRDADWWEAALRFLLGAAFPV